MTTIPVSGDGPKKNGELHRAGRLRSSPSEPMLTLFFNADLVHRRPDRNLTVFPFWTTTPLAQEDNLPRRLEKMSGKAGEVRSPLPRPETYVW